MAITIDEIKRSNLFVKSSTDDFQDPVFLTFTIDFFPPSEEYPKTDGLTSSCLLKSDVLEIGPPNPNQNQNVEYSAFKWLQEYYPEQLSGISPAKSMEHFIKRLAEVQDSPWYFQSIQGIGDLWKGLHRVKEGNQKTVLTINCIDSIRQPLTDMTEHYRYAVYDNDRLAYRLPENLRWFDMVINLVEIRDIADKSGQFYRTDASGNLVEGLKVIKFNCKMCEFDFSNFMGGSQSDHKVYTEEKPFSPSFNINVGWVIQEQVALNEANDYRKMGMFAGALGTLNNRLTRFLQTATRLPASIVGSVLTDIQTYVETKVMGNIYTGMNEFLYDMGNLGGEVTGRTPPVGPTTVNNVGMDIYPNETMPEVKNIGDTYPNIIPDRRSTVGKMGDIYPNDTPGRGSTVGRMEDVYPDLTPEKPVTNIGDIYPDQPGVNVSTMDDIYPDEPIIPQANTMGDVYQEEPSLSQSEIGDVYPDQPASPSVSDLGDSYPGEQNTPQVDDIGDIYPDQPAAPSVSELGDVYPDEPAAVQVGEMGDIYP